MRLRRRNVVAGRALRSERFGARVCWCVRTVCWCICLCVTLLWQRHLTTPRLLCTQENTFAQLPWRGFVAVYCGVTMHKEHTHTQNTHRHLHTLHTTHQHQKCFRRQQRSLERWQQQEAAMGRWAWC